MKIYTSYFAMLSRIPKELLPISIAGKAPEWYMGFQYKKLAPRYDFFMKYKETGDEAYYIEQYNTRVLSELNPKEVVKKLEEMSGGDDVILLCYEKPGEFCHRHLVSDWLNHNGFKCSELEFEKGGVI